MAGHLLWRVNEPISPRPRPAWPDYRAVWRWHFYASLFCMPFVVGLSLSGAVCLFKPQIEAWLDRPCDQLEVVGNAASAAEHVQAALVVVLPIERLILTRIPTRRDWLGLHRPAALSVS